MIKTRIVLVWIICICGGFAFGQAFVKQVGSSQNDLANDVALTSTGDIVMVGFTQSDITDKKTNNTTTSTTKDEEKKDEEKTGAHIGGNDAFIMRLAKDSLSNNSKPVYIQQFGTSQGDAASAVVLDAQDNSYVVGGTEGNLAATNAGVNDAFLLSFDTAGKERFAVQFGTALDDGASAVALGTNDNIIMVGFTKLALTEDSVHAGGSDVYVRSYSTSGDLQWTTQFGSARDDVATALTVLADGSIVIGGSAEEAMPENKHFGNSDGFIAKLSAAGELLFVFQFGTHRNDSIVRLVSDESRIYGAGITQGMFGMKQHGSEDMFVIAFDYDGVTTGLEQFGSSKFDVVQGLALDKKSDSLYLTGFTQGSVKEMTREQASQPDNGDVLANNNDIFMIKLNSDLIVIDGEQYGTPQDDNGRSVYIDDTQVYVVGGTGGTLMGGESLGGNDAFLLVYPK